MVFWIFKVSSLWSYFLIIFSRILILFPHFKNMNTFIYVVGSSFLAPYCPDSNSFVFLFYLKQMSQNPYKTSGWRTKLIWFHWGEGTPLIQYSGFGVRSRECPMSRHLLGQRDNLREADRDLMKRQREPQHLFQLHPDNLEGGRAVVQYQDPHSAKLFNALISEL